MSRAVEQYLAQLRASLAGADTALIQDALSDAEEHLTAALEQALAKEPGIAQDAVLESFIETYGAPGEVAAAYKEMETMTTIPFAAAPPSPNIEVRRRHGFFGVLGDIHTYGALLYMLFSLVTGIVYFTWAVTGLSLSAGLMILVIGIPLMTAFLLSVRGIAFVEGKLVEAVLGERMPRRSVFFKKDLGWWGAVKALFTDRTTWTAMLYLILQLPLGIIYFTVMITLIAVSLALIAEPVLHYVFDVPFVQTNHHYYYLPGWTMPFLVIGGILLLIVTLHAARGIGRLHGRYAKKLLVKGE